LRAHDAPRDARRPARLGVRDQVADWRSRAPRSRSAPHRGARPVDQRRGQHRRRRCRRRDQRDRRGDRRDRGAPRGRRQALLRRRGHLRAHRRGGRRRVRPGVLDGPDRRRDDRRPGRGGRSRPPAATRRSRSCRCWPTSTFKRRGRGSVRPAVWSGRRSPMSWVETELREQPVALERFLAAETAHATEIASGLVRDDVHYLLVVSRGSSSNVARYLQYLFGTVNRLTVAFATPSLYTVYDAPPELGPAAVVGISQSGASPDVVAVVDEARRQRRPTLAITNDSRSPLAQAADWVLPL